MLMVRSSSDSRPGFKPAADLTEVAYGSGVSLNSLTAGNSASAPDRRWQTCSSPEGFALPVGVEIHGRGKRAR